VTENKVKEFYHMAKRLAEMEQGAKVTARHARMGTVEAWVKRRLIEVSYYKTCEDLAEVVGVKIPRMEIGWSELAKEFPSEKMLANVHLALEFNKPKCAYCHDPMSPDHITKLMGADICMECIVKDPTLLEQYKMHMLTHPYGYGVPGATGATGATGPAAPTGPRYRPVTAPPPKKGTP